MTCRNVYFFLKDLYLDIIVIVLNLKKNQSILKALYSVMQQIQRKLTQMKIKNVQLFKIVKGLVFFRFVG